MQSERFIFPCPTAASVQRSRRPHSISVNSAGGGVPTRRCARIAGMRQSVPLDRCTRLLNHGPTVLVSAQSGGRRNVMAAAWSMPLDFTPPKVAVVLDKQTFTRTLIEASGHFALCVPPVALAAMTTRVGNESGRDGDKFESGLAGADAGPITGAPLIDGCIAWLECRHIPEPHIEQAYDLFLGEVVAAWADDRVFRDGRWHFTGVDASLRSIHHIAGGHYLAIGDEIAYEANALDSPDDLD
jgi:flavin reductase (DIM6/NTAB) family NADH-FMN oxidoreductase RutF